MLVFAFFNQPAAAAHLATAIHAATPGVETAWQAGDGPGGRGRGCGGCPGTQPARATRRLSTYRWLAFPGVATRVREREKHPLTRGPCPPTSPVNIFLKRLGLPGGATAPPDPLPFFGPPAPMGWFTPINGGAKPTHGGLEAHRRGVRGGGSPPGKTTLYHGHQCCLIYSVNSRFSQKGVARQLE